VAPTLQTNRTRHKIITEGIEAVSEEIFTLVAEANTEVVVGTSKIFTGMRQAGVEATQAVSHLSTPPPNRNFLRSIQTLKMAPNRNLRLPTTMEKIFSDPLRRIFRLKIRRRLKRKTRRRCHLRTGHPPRRHKPSKTHRSLALPSKRHQKLPPQPQSPRYHRNSMLHQVGQLCRRVLNADHHPEQFLRSSRFRLGDMSSATLPLLQHGK
jgi:hypothetical protein